MLPVHKASSTRMDDYSLVERVSSSVRDVIPALGIVHKQARCCVCLTLCKRLTPASHVCLTCGDTLCNKCLQLHNSSSTTHAHRAVVVADVMNGIFKVDVHMKCRCNSHRNWYVEFHCLSCSENACPLDLYKHKGHDVNDLDSVAQACRASMMEMSQSIKDKIIDPVTAVLHRVKQHTHQKVEVTQIVDEIFTERKRDAADTADTSTSVRALVKSASLILSAVEEASLASNANLLNFYPGIRNCMELVINSVPNDEQLATALKKLRVNLSTDEPPECVTNIVQSLGQGLNPTLPSVIVDNTTAIRTSTLVEEKHGEETHANKTLETSEDDPSPIASVLSEGDTMDPHSDQSKCTHKQSNGNGARNKKSGVLRYDGHSKQISELQSIASPNPDKTGKVQDSKTSSLKKELAVTRHLDGKTTAIQPSLSPKQMLKETKSKNKNTMSRQSTESISKKLPQCFRLSACLTLVSECGLDPRIVDCSYEYVKDPNFSWVADDVPSGILADVFLVPERYTQKATSGVSTAELESFDHESIGISNSQETASCHQQCTSGQERSSLAIQQRDDQISKAVHQNTASKHVSQDGAPKQLHDGATASQSAPKQGREMKLDKTTASQISEKQVGASKQSHNETTANTNAAKKFLSPKKVCDKTIANENSVKEDGMSKQLREDTTASKHAAEKKEQQQNQKKRKRKEQKKIRKEKNAAKQDRAQKQSCYKTTASQNSANAGGVSKQICGKSTANSIPAKEDGVSKQLRDDPTTSSNAVKQGRAPQQLSDKSSTSGPCTVDNMEQKAKSRPDDTEFKANTSTHEEVKHIGTCNAQLKHVGSIKLATSQDEDNPHVIGMCLCRGNRIVFLDDANTRLKEIDVIGRHCSTHRPSVLCTAFCSHGVVCCGNNIVYLGGNYVHITNAVLELRCIIKIEQNPSGSSTSLAPLVLCNYNKLSFLVANLPDNMYRVYDTDGKVVKSRRFPVKYPIVAMSLSVDEESILASTWNHFGAVYRVNKGTHVTMTFRPPEVTQWYPESTCSDRKNNVYVACPHQHQIYIFLPSGELWFVHSTWLDDPALLPRCLIMSRDDTLFVSGQPPRLYKYVLQS